MLFNSTHFALFPAVGYNPLLCHVKQKHIELLNKTSRANNFLYREIKIYEIHKLTRKNKYNK
jgi:hypothetical protein